VARRPVSHCQGLHDLVRALSAIASRLDVLDDYVRVVTVSLLN
jgi:hypothetical protein